MAALDLLAIISPKPGKTDRVVELLQKVSEYVKANEPGTLKYEILRAGKDRASGKEEVVMAET
jgi:quinol monooxygenase YgiN